MTSSFSDLPILDRIPFLDDRSLHPDFSARRLIGPTARYKRVWTSRFEPLDQGREGACVGFACAGELAATPIKHTVSNASALLLYRKAQEVDRSEGRNYPSGATVLAGMKACNKAGLFGKYVWNFGIDDTIDWIVRRGPVVLGINWYESMYDAATDGLIEVSGRKVGGHAILCNGYWPNHPQFGPVLVLTNSWGLDWGIRGRGFLPIDVADRLLKEDGESVAPTDLPMKRVANPEGM
jgi:hypothetical protein